MIFSDEERQEIAEMIRRLDTLGYAVIRKSRISTFIAQTSLPSILWEMRRGRYWRTASETEQMIKDRLAQAIARHLAEKNQILIERHRGMPYPSLKVSGHLTVVAPEAVQHVLELKVHATANSVRDQG